MTDNQELTVTGTLTLEDFKRYNTYHSKKSVTIYFFICFVVFFAIFQQAISGTWTLVFIITAIPAFILSSLLVLAVKMVNKRRAVKEYNSDQLIKNEISYTFTTEGITQKIRKSTNYYEWNDIHSARALEELFLLYVSQNKAIVLPKRFFGSRDEVKLFKAIVRENLESTKIKF